MKIRLLEKQHWEIALEVTNSYEGPVLSHLQCFEKMFSSQVFRLLVEMSNTYAGYNNHSLNVSVNEMKVFVAVIMLTGYLKPKYMRIFWEEQSDTYNKLIAQSIRRDRFFEIRQ
uniref:PiggyBac transposable element-derived protein 3 n=1 Tax=Lygus hesperus TaxID=30085 RepID=A0A0A9VSJ2_LYGHE